MFNIIEKLIFIKTDIVVESDIIFIKYWYLFLWKIYTCDTLIQR